jgi:hypothetical protein
MPTRGFERVVRVLPVIGHLRGPFLDLLEIGVMDCPCDRRMDLLPVF